MSSTTTKFAAKDYNVDPKDIPHLPGTAFPDPHRTNYPVAHALDMCKAVETLDDEKAVGAPTGLTSAYTATLHPVDFDERRALRTQATMKQPSEDLAWAAGATQALTTRGEFLKHTRGAIGCRTDSLNALMATGVRPDATLLPRTHDEERAFARQIEPFTPEFALLDRVVLRFLAWFTEDVHESQAERRRVRHVFIDYYLSDRTIQVQERPVLNAGIPQGDLIKRHRIPRDPRDETQGYLQLSDLHIGDAVSLYGKVFYIYGCNDSTRSFLECQCAAGETVPPNMRAEDVPEDPYIAEREATTLAVTQKTHVTKHVPDDRLAKYLRHDREVLRFFSVWDNRSIVFGEVRLLVIHYFLADDTVEVLEVLPTNSGRDPFPCFLRRQRVPKRHTMTQFAEHGLITNEFYGARDFRIGTVVNIFGRSLYLYDCDEYTRDYLVRELRCTPESVAPIRRADVIGETASKALAPTVQLQDLFGLSRTEMSAKYQEDVHKIGADEDTVGSCISIHPEAPRSDMLRWLKFGNVCLRYIARFAPAAGKPVHITQADRRFIVSYFFSDNTISVFEPVETTQPGFGNKFLERQLVVNKAKTTAQDLAATGNKSYAKVYMDYTDLALGRVVEINGSAFELLSCDERTKRIAADLEAAGNNLDKFDAAPYNN